MARTEPTALDLLELDLDSRLLVLWFQAWDVGTWDLEILAPFLRVAYWTGYMEALTEKQRGRLLRDHGQQIPPRKAR